MTKEEFKKKYHNAFIKITPDGDGVMDSNAALVRSVCERLGLLPTTMTSVNSPYPLIGILDPVVTGTSENHLGYDAYLSSISVSDFIADWRKLQLNESLHSNEEIDSNENVVRLLREFEIKCDSFEKVSNFDSRTLYRFGFVQGRTSNEASLWWHVGGTRFFLIRGLGVFKLKGEGK